MTIIYYYIANNKYYNKIDSHSRLEGSKNILKSNEISCGYEFDIIYKNTYKIVNI